MKIINKQYIKNIIYDKLKVKLNYKENLKKIYLLFYISIIYLMKKLKIGTVNIYLNTLSTSSYFKTIYNVVK